MELFFFFSSLLAILLFQGDGVCLRFKQCGSGYSGDAINIWHFCDKTIV